MPVLFPDVFAPTGPFPIVKDVDVFGGFQVVANQAAREAIVIANQKVGMLVYQGDTGVTYRLNAVAATPNTNWVLTNSENFYIVSSNIDRDNISSSARQQGMIVYSLGAEKYYSLIGGVTNSNWVALQDDSRLDGGLRVVADSATRLAIIQARQKVGMLVLQADTRELYRLSVVGSPGTYVRVMTFGATADHIEVSDIKTATITADSSILSTDIVVTENELGLLAGLTGRVFVSTIGGAGARVNGLSDRRRSSVLWGCELTPAALATGVGTFYAAVAVVAAGSIAYPSGLVTKHTGSYGARFDEASSYIEGSVPSFSSWTNIYVFSRAEGPNSPTTFEDLRLSTSPPDSRGRPTSSISGEGVTIDDFAYMGVLRAKLSTISGSSDPHFDIWGLFSVSHDGNGGRFLELDPDDPASVGASHSVTAAINGTANYLTVGAATTLNSRFVTARHCDILMDIKFDSIASATGTAIVTATAGGVHLEINSFADLRDRVIFSVSSRNERFYLKALTSNGYTGTVDYVASSKIMRVFENVNAPNVEYQLDFGLTP